MTTIVKDPNSKRGIGNKAETLASAFLMKNGYQLLDRNFTIRGGEIDIITIHKNVLVFVEVKARYNHQFGLPEESITPWKLKALYRTGEVYANKIKWGDRPMRFDLVTIDFTDDRNYPEIKLIENIFF